MRRACATLVLAAALASTLIGTAGSTGNARPCWKLLINEWYSGQIRTVFPIHCYVHALHRIPTDSLILASARRDIRAAEIAAEHGKPAPPEKPLPQPPGTPPTTRTSPPSLVPCVITKPGPRCA